jgi:RNA polymerase sigma factor (sigma-70 family)
LKPKQPNPEQPASPDSDKQRQHSARVAELFATHNRELVLFLTRKLRNPQEAKEVAQEAYVKMLQLDAPGGISYLRAFLYKTAVNLAANRMKSAVRRTRVDELDFFDEINLAPSPESCVAADQELHRILELIDELPAKCRHAFVMNRWVGHDFPEVAKLMGLSERMIRLYVERAMVFCQKRLAETGGSDE